MKVLLGAAALTGLLLTQNVAEACYGRPPIFVRVAGADCIVVGRIVAIETNPVQVRRHPSSTQTKEYQVAVVAIEQGLLGAQGLTRVRLGFVAKYQNRKVGQEALFFMTRHFEEDFFVGSMLYDIQKNNAGFGRNIMEIKEYTSLLANPKAGLQSPEAKQRLKTAAILLATYKSNRYGRSKQVAIPTEESKLILNAILHADWNDRTDYRTSAQGLFLQLRLTPQDGWVMPPIKDYKKEFPPIAKNWLRKNVDTYRIKKVVAN